MARETCPAILMITSSPAALIAMPGRLGSGTAGHVRRSSGTGARVPALPQARRYVQTGGPDATFAPRARTARQDPGRACTSRFPPGTLVSYPVQLLSARV